MPPPPALLLLALLAASAPAALAVPAASAPARGRPARVVVGSAGETARVIFRAPPGDPFILTNFGNGFLSLTELDRHVLTFGVTRANASAPPPVSGARRERLPQEPQEQPREQPQEQPQQQPQGEEPTRVETPAFRELRQRVDERRAAAGPDVVLSLLEEAEGPAAAKGGAKGRRGGRKGKDDDGVEERTFLHVGNLTVEGTVHVRKAAPAVALVPQWALVDQDDFESEASRGRWFPQDFGTCGYADVHLGGACNFAKALPTRTYKALPKHTYLRVEARYHFLDKWEGEYGFAKADGKVVWTEVHHHCPKIWSTLCNGVSVCGDADVADTLSTAVTVTFPHNADELELSFGSSLTTDPCDASFGIDDVKVFAL